MSEADDQIRGFYRSVYSCADNHDPEMRSKIHISTPIEDALVKAANVKKVVIVTGNPGDGKTHMIMKIEGESDFPKKTPVNVDANVTENGELISAINGAITTKRPYVLAINEGILLDICEQARKRHEWPDKIIRAIREPYDYDEPREEHDRIAIFDLNLRNNLSESVVRQALDKILSLADDDKSSPYFENVQRLKDPSVRQRLFALLDTVAQTGIHATMRELLGFVSYLVCGGEDEDRSGRAKPFYMNAFDGGVGALFDAIREYDPLQMPAPFLDYRLYTAADADDDWFYIPDDEMRTEEDIEVFKARKRRAYFEHKEGDKILRRERSGVDHNFEMLRRKDQSPETVAISLLNRFFDSNSNDDSNDQLVLWFSHQFSARVVRYVVSSQAINASEFEILVPRLPAYLSEVFPDHYPDHVIFRHKQMPLSDGLVIDRRFLKMLIEGDRINGLGSRNPEAHTKIASFYDRLTKLCTRPLKKVRILRLDNLRDAQIGVNIEERSYFNPRGR